MFFQAISLAISASLRAADKVMYPMMVTVVVNILNIIGNYVLIFGKFGAPALGVEGAAISTSIARGVSMLILFIILFKKHIPSFPMKLFRPFPWIELKNLLKIGLPSAGEEISYSSTQVVITYFINMLGNEALATRTYCWNMLFFVLVFSISIAQAGSILPCTIPCHGQCLVQHDASAALQPRLPPYWEADPGHWPLQPSVLQGFGLKSGANRT